MHEELSDIDLYVSEYEHGRLIRNLRDGVLDIGIAMGNLRHEDLVIQRLWSDPMWAVVPASHPLAQASYLSRDDLRSCRLIVCHPDSDDGDSEQIRALIAEKVIEPTIAQYASSVQGMLLLRAE